MWFYCKFLLKEILKIKFTKTQNFLRIVQTNLKKKYSFYCLDDFLELLKNDFNERSFSENTNKTDGKWTITLRTKETIYFSTIEKKNTEWVVHERWTNEWKMSNVLISTQNYSILKRVKMLQWDPKKYGLGRRNLDNFRVDTVLLWNK